jgi:hypothetical protein
MLAESDRTPADPANIRVAFDDLVYPTPETSPTAAMMQETAYLDVARAVVRALNDPAAYGTHMHVAIKET